MKEEFNKIISESVKPFLKANGFKKKGLNFYRVTDSIIFLLNFQKSFSNTSDETRFYINCNIHSNEIDEVLGRAKIVEPKEYDTFYRNRISEIIQSERAYYTINAETDVQQLTTDILTDLGVAIHLFDSVQSTDDLVNLMIRDNGLSRYEELLTYFLLKNKEKEASEYINKLYHNWGTDKRWEIFGRKIKNILVKYSNNQTMSDLINF